MVTEDSGFGRQLTKLRKGGKFKEQAEERLNSVKRLLSLEAPLPAHWRDHQLTGDKKALRQVHIKGNIVLEYKVIPTTKSIVLYNIGSHSQQYR
jgi:mRNA interferase YafQ